MIILSSVQAGAGNIYYKQGRTSMNQKTFYYHFAKTDSCFISLVVDMFVLLALGLRSPYAWGIVGCTFLLWLYKDVMKRPAVIVTDKNIKIDHCAPLSWSDIKGAEIKEVNLYGDVMKVISLIPKNGIKYDYNWLQTHNGDFGAFSIPLYGILRPEDEKEIVRLIQQKVSVK